MQAWEVLSYMNVGKRTEEIRYYLNLHRKIGWLRKEKEEEEQKDFHCRKQS